MKYAARHLKKADIPHSYAGVFFLIVAFVNYLVFPTWYASWLMETFTRKWAKPKDFKMLSEFYLPELKNSTKGLYVSNWDKFIIMKQLWCTFFIKILYAFLFQEVIIPLKFTKWTPVHYLGGVLAPWICWMADIISW